MLRNCAFGHIQIDYTVMCQQTIDMLRDCAFDPICINYIVM